MTSNLGVKKLQDFGGGIGFGTQAKTYVQEEHKRDMLKKELQKFFAPEFLNRIDEVIIFNQLVKEDVKKIVKLEINVLSKRLSKMKYNFTFDDTVTELISEVGFDELYGARPLKRAIQDRIEDYISEEILNGNVLEDVDYTMTVVDKEIKINVLIDNKPKKGRKKKGVE